MRAVTLAHEEDFDGWRDAARSLALARVPPSEVTWSVGDAPPDLFGEEAVMPAVEGPAFSVPRPFVDLARTVICHSEPERFSLLYAMLLRLRARPGVLGDKADPLLRRLEEMAKSVRRDMHKMHAFVRFREVDEPDGGTRYVAWFEPDHHIVRSNAGFFVRRFTTMRWSILTPELSIHWDGETLTQSPGATRADAPSGDPVEETWKTYYASIFNPARVKVKAMTKEMPKKYWKNMPETALVGDLIAGAQAREAEMVARSRSKVAAEVREAGHDAAEAAERRLQPGGNALAAWEALFEEARGCTRCHLYKHATQTVFGEGPVDAPLMFVGEQPGDQEDLAGRAFVGPAGQLFDKALKEAGINRAKAYITNAVKHFKFEPRGTRRIHQTPKADEIKACHYWYDRERALIRPQVTVALGATAARQVFGRAVTISSLRGEAHKLAEGGEAWVTVHPSFLLRVRDNREAEYQRFVEDLARIGERVKALS
ncbi:UdgX family uracil-DNA binding protein [Allosphingosinicella flava]|uniref:Type-4 uracil-DNA glycosylase n=1 Tax=Allosphingosinicella flava TaxID=2771430 RepID=A0A7T2GIC6_9SPHN|nr:UdgX family uracil-DNA binding protein [Sphingosinicella flava]QPQ54257.1 UdgX family uracil-DNA binding protein [Sphingosinicella flava]